MKVTLKFETEKERLAAAQFISELVRQGVQFVTVECGDTLEVSFTGGF
jgi:hypothetical protein